MLAAGTQLGKYKVAKLLGSGGMADVYLATDVRIKRQVAMKVLPPEFGRNAEHAARFKREVMASAALEHPGIVSIFDVGQSEHNSLRYQYYVMKLLPKGDLKNKIEAKLSLAEIFRITKELASALDYAHKQGFVHRDIKPENILFDREDKAVLTDLGIARAMRSDNRMTDTGMSVGTPNYMSPEQAKGKYDLDGRADLYSLGVVLFEMLTGDVPYHADTTIGLALRHVNDPVPNLPKKFHLLQPIVNQLMAKDPEDRYPTAKALLKDVALIEKHGKLKNKAPQNTNPQNQRRSRAKTHSQGRKKRTRKRFLLLFLLASAVAFISFRPFLVEQFVTDSMELLPIQKQPPSVDQLEAISVAKSNSKKKKEQQKRRASVNRLLRLAEEDLQALRLTKPKGSSAFDKYQQVLSLEPDNQDAQQGMNKIVQNYLKLAEKNYSRGNTKGALAYLETARKIAPDSLPVSQMINRYKSASKSAAQRKVKPAKLNYTIGNVFTDTLASGLLGPKLVVVPPGSFTMGNTKVGGDSDEKPTFKVKLRKKFSVSQYEITFNDYDRFARATNRAQPKDEGWGRGNRPVINVSWYDAVAYTDWLSQQSGFRYRLLSEAEWEYVAKAGKNSLYFWGNKPSHRYANYKAEACCDPDDKRVRKWNRTAPVGTYKPNAFGLHDMAGNVWEWVMDCKARYNRGNSNGRAIDLPNCDERVVRGGSWGSKPDALRITNRAGRSPLKPGKYNGFRVLRVIP